MKKTIQFLYTLLFISFCIYWVYSGDRLGKKEWDEEKQKEIKGKVVRIEKPEGHKIMTITFSDGVKYSPSFFGFNSLIEIGDSIYKERGSYKFMSMPFNLWIFNP